MNRILRRTLTALLFGVSTSVVLATDNLADASKEAAASSDYAIISRDVLVQEGDTLAKIALKELGKISFVPLLADFNNIQHNASLAAGEYIRIPIHVPQRLEYAEVVFVKGTVTVTRELLNGQRGNGSTVMVSNSPNATSSGVSTEVVKLDRNSQIFAGDLIETANNGYVSIAFSSGSVINLQPDTIASLDRLFCLETDDSCQIEINTQQGRVTSNVETRDQQPVHFRISTPYASAAVRGTVFDVNASEKLLVGVLEGSVEVSALNENVSVDTGFGVSVEEGSPPSQPIELIPGPVFKRVSARFTTGDTLEWWPFGDASSYAATLSNDELAQQVLTDFAVPGGNTALLDVASNIEDIVEPGDYFITVRALDQQGLSGFPSNTRITLASIDASVDPVSTQVVRDGSEFLVNVQDGPEEAIGYEIQISNDEAFSDPLSVDVNRSGSAVFRIDEDKVFTRARVLLDPYTVSAFGGTSSSN